jgi:hypothetical protein
MAGLFGSSDPPPPPPPPPAPAPAPTIDSARAAQKSADTALSRKGRAATILTSSTGDLSGADTSKKTLGS